MLDKLTNHSFIASSDAKNIYKYFGMDIKKYEKKEKVGRRFIKGADTYDIAIQIKLHLGLPLSRKRSSSFQFKDNVQDIKNHIKPML